MNREIDRIIDFASDTGNEISSLSVEQTVGQSGHEILKIRFLQGNHTKQLFCKIYNNKDHFFDDKQMIKVESYALRRAHSVGIPGPQVIATDVSGDVVGKPLLVTSFVEGETLSSVLEKADNKRLLVDNAIAAIREPIIKMQSITNRNTQFGPIFTPSWIGDVSNMKEFMMMGLYREFWRAKMLDENYTFLSDWAHKVNRWTSGAIERFTPAKYQLCHGDFCVNNIVVALNKDYSKVNLTAVVDWEYAHWSVAEIDVGNFLASLSPYIDTKDILISASKLIPEKLDKDLVKVAIVHRIMIQMNQKGISEEKKQIFAKRINSILDLK